MRNPKYTVNENDNIMSKSDTFTIQTQRTSNERTKDYTSVCTAIHEDYIIE
jgi:hypothetical protein